MKHLFFIGLLIGFVACKTDSPAEIVSNSEQQVPEVIKPADVVEGPHTYDARALDSLSFTYNSENSKIQDGLYFITESATATINLLPIELWEIMIPRNPAFFHRAKPKDTWALIHRIDNVKFSTAAKPVTVETDGTVFNITIPFDGTSSSNIQQLLDLRGKGNYGLVLDAHLTYVFYEGKGIATDGLHIATERKEELAFLQDYYNSAP